MADNPKMPDQSAEVTSNPFEIAKLRIDEAAKNDVEFLSLKDLQLGFLPENIIRCRNLQQIDLSGNHIADLSPLHSLERLSSLSLTNNQVDSIEELKIPPKIQTLDLSFNKGMKRIASLGELFVLNVLTLVECELEDVIFLSRLKMVRELNLSNNRIREVTNLRNLSTVRFLNLRGNQVVDISPILEMKGLESLNLSNNKITNEGAKALLNMSSLAELSLAGNNLEGVPEEIQENLNALREHFSISFTTNENETPQEPAKEPAFRSASMGRIALAGSPDASLIDVDQLSKIFYEFIAESETNVEKFFGLFGRWGRGKTYLWKFLKENHLDHKKYIPVEFHAWKYQDTPGLWAYLYATLNKEYFNEAKRNHKSRVGRFFARVGRLIKLNTERGKVIRPLLILIGGISVAAGLYIFLTSQIEFFKSITAQILTFAGIVSFSIYGLVDFLIKKYKNDARQVYSQIASNVSFQTQLGLQHEIQEELKKLLKAWIPAVKKKGPQKDSDKIEVNRRIFLFIDDIDRCSEDKIIQIVDYIRVLLDDDEIKARITILAAIDERILIHAIQNKYRRFIENKDNDATYKELCREYMDKLFLSGLKLGPLTEYEREEMVNGFTKPYLRKLAEKTTEKATGNVNPFAIQPIGGNGTDTTTNSTGQPGTSGQPLTQNLQTVTNSPEAEQLKSEEYGLEQWEQEFLIKLVSTRGDLTPRNIRVFTYRYLLGKKLIEKPLKNESKPSYQQWYYTQDARKCFALKLYYYSFKGDVDNLYSNYRSFLAAYDETKPDRTVEEEVYKFKVQLNQELGSIMYQVLTMIVAY